MKICVAILSVLRYNAHAGTVSFFSHVFINLYWIQRVLGFQSERPAFRQHDLKLNITSS